MQSDPNHSAAMNSPQHPQHPSVTSLGHSAGNSAANMVTPLNSGMSMERWMAQQMGMRRAAAAAAATEEVTPLDRAEVSSAVYGILRDNLPPSLEATTSQEELTLIANSVEGKLYDTASSPRAYRALSTLDFRITALATAILIHNDKDKTGGGAGPSRECAKLASAARKSLVYCVMVLVSYEKRLLERDVRSRMLQDRIAQRAEAYVQRLEGVDRRAWEYHQSQLAAAERQRGREMAAESSDPVVNRMVEEWYAQREAMGSGNDMHNMGSTGERRRQAQGKVSAGARGGDHRAGEDKGGSNRGVGVQMVEESRKVQPFPPSA